MTFNLLDEPWLPCYDLEGRFRLLGIRQALLDAHKLRELRDADPLATCALQRLLLAVLHRALNGPKSMKAWIGVWERGSFDKAPLERYLKKWEGRFDLFGVEHPFYQVAGFETLKPITVRKLTETLASGHNATLFDHSLDEASGGLSPAEAARYLVVCQAFGLAGLSRAKSKAFDLPSNFSNGPMVGALSAMLKGKNLFESLALNLLVLNSKEDLPIPSMEDDAPAWEGERVEGPGRRRCKGWLDLVTWHSRFVRLIEEKGVVRNIYLAQGYSMDNETRPPDPFWFLKIFKDEVKAVWPDVDRMMWRDLEGLFAFNVQAKNGVVRRPLVFKQVYEAWDTHGVKGLEENRFSFQIFGLAKDGKKAKPLAFLQQTFTVPIELLEDNGRLFRLFSDAIKIAERGGDALRESLKIYATAFLMASKNRSKLAPEELSRLRGHLESRHQYWQSLDIGFGQFANALASDSEVAFSRWVNGVRIAVAEAFEQSLGGVALAGSRSLKAKVHARVNLDSMLNTIFPKKGEEALQ
jgi:CRISPR system Cascade subunit CasA